MLTHARGKETRLVERGSSILTAAELGGLGWKGRAIPESEKGKYADKRGKTICKRESARIKDSTKATTEPWPKGQYFGSQEENCIGKGTRRHLTRGGAKSTRSWRRLRYSGE